jgi:gp16 family phage-associated protein
MQTEALIPLNEPVLGSITPAEKARFKYLLARQGKTISKWADETGVDYMSTLRVLRAYNKGRYGNSFDSAQAVRAFLSVSS